MKRCSKCHTSFPCTTDYFYRHPETTDGFQGRCKACMNAYSNARYRHAGPSLPVLCVCGMPLSGGLYFCSPGCKARLTIGVVGGLMEAARQIGGIK